MEVRVAVLFVKGGTVHFFHGRVYIYIHLYKHIYIYISQLLVVGLVPGGLDS